ncbi:glycosyltransferase family 2 protein [Bradyrhizobium sp. SZCCHNR1070]|uniref:glycosyltransferase family 2 protein n=1 Tax=Bradyrhizobium sp. SZCCHNR1070 TaxID=3057361 RepID=UPI002916D322|nr:glycosyltransferase family 2 protein [Bradyrhizobium sp. SZCCHNR1070]
MQGNASNWLWMNDVSGKSRPRLLVITPVYNEAANLDRYVAETTRTLGTSENTDIRFLLIDDGSADGSWAKIEQICRDNPAFSGLRLSRNFGAHLALTAGMDHVGPDVDVVATLAADLQDPPDTVLRFLTEWRKGASIVWGRRRTRRDHGWRRLVSMLFENLIRRYAMPRGSKFTTGSFFLADRRVVDCFKEMRESARVTFALIAWTGFDQAVVDYDRASRTAGKSGWTFGRMIHAFYDVVMSFSQMPARVLTTVGLATSALSGAALIYLVGIWLFSEVQPGWTGIMATMTLFFGVLFLMLGIISEYLYRILLETKKRPLYFVARSVGLQSEGSQLEP